MRWDSSFIQNVLHWARALVFNETWEHQVQEIADSFDLQAFIRVQHPMPWNLAPESG